MTRRARPEAEAVDVLVVGAGPVGLLAALAAASRGLKVSILDQYPPGYSPGRASLLHSRSLSLLAEYGLLSELAARGRLLDRITLRSDQASFTLQLPHPVLALSQDVLENVLRTELSRHNVKVQAPRQASALEQSAADVTVRVLHRELVRFGSPALYSDWETFETRSIQARFLIGADGYDSRIRTSLGIETQPLGSTETFAMFDFDAAAPLDEINLCFEGELSSSLLPLPGARARAGFMVDRDFATEPDLERLRELLLRRLGPGSPEPSSLTWSSVTHFERRLARQFGKGRGWLAGDAAHITAPFGNHSINAGLEEAHELVQRIADSGPGAGTSQLEEYGAEREREWHKLLGVNVSFDVLPHAPAWLIPHARSLVPALPASGAELTTLLERIGLRLS